MARSKKGNKEVKPAPSRGPDTDEAKAVKRSGRRSFLKGAGGLAAAAAMAPLAAAQENGNENITMEMPLDAEKIDAIQKCIAKGKLSMTISRVSLQNSSGANSVHPWLYD